MLVRVVEDIRDDGGTGFVVRLGGEVGVRVLVLVLFPLLL
jgi:hypothetical protein